MAAIVARTKVVLQFRSKFFWNGHVFGEGGVPTIAIGDEEGCGRDVLSDPVRIAGGSVVGRCEGRRIADVRDGSWEAILEDAGRIDGRKSWFSL